LLQPSDVLLGYLRTSPSSAVINWLVTMRYTLFLVAKQIVVLPKSVTPARITSNLTGALAAANRLRFDTTDLKTLDNLAASGKQKRWAYAFPCQISWVYILTDSFSLPFYRFLTPPWRTYFLRTNWDTISADFFCSCRAWACQLAHIVTPSDESPLLRYHFLDTRLSLYGSACFIAAPITRAMYLRALIITWQKHSCEKLPNDFHWGAVNCD
jgi:hypothetical protein